MNKKSLLMKIAETCIVLYILAMIFDWMITSTLGFGILFGIIGYVSSLFVLPLIGSLFGIEAHTDAGVDFELKLCLIPAIILFITGIILHLHIRKEAEAPYINTTRKKQEAPVKIQEAPKTFKETLNEPVTGTGLIPAAVVVIVMLALAIWHTLGIKDWSH
jgi:hypothetical protein